MVPDCRPGWEQSVSLKIIVRDIYYLKYCVGGLGHVLASPLLWGGWLEECEKLKFRGKRGKEKMDKIVLITG